MKELVMIGPEILGGTPVFRGTRVPVQTSFDYLERDDTLAEFLECFPTVTREMACAVLEHSEAACSRLWLHENFAGRVRAVAVAPGC